LGSERLMKSTRLRCTDSVGDLLPGLEVLRRDLRFHISDRDLRFHISDSLSVKSTQATCCRRKQFFQSTLQNDCYGKLLQAGYCKQDVQHCRTPATTLCTECAEWSTSKPWTGCSALSVSASITPVTLIPRRRSKVRMSTFL